MADNQKKPPSLDPPFGADNKANGKADKDVLDSWENESLSSSDDETHDNMSTMGKDSPASTVTTASMGRTNARSRTNTPSDVANSPHYGIRAPPSTPLARSLGSSSGWSSPDPSARAASAGPSAGTPNSANTSPGGPQKRPEKQTAVANRLIAGALGVRTQRSEEQISYDRAIRDNERRRIARERQEEVSRRLEEERKKSAIWEEEE